MSEVAEKIRIADLAHPVLTELQAGALGYCQANPVTLTPEAVLAAAQQGMGLSDFGPDDFRERLAVWMRAGDNDTELSAAGRASLFSEAVRLASNRLQLEDTVKRHPEILDIQIERPLIIAGLPRSGTTYTLQLMSADPRLRSLPHWEAVRPIAAPWIKDGKDTRHDLCAAEWAQTDAVMPYIKMIHEFSPDHISEDIELQGLDFGGYYFEWIAHVPEWRDYQFAHDATSVMRYVRKAMQVLSWQKGPNRWVTKCPQHMEQLLAVKGAFPDSYIVINHRDPVASIQSAITGIAYGARLTRTRVDMQGIADYWIDRYERLLRNCVRDRDQIDASQSCDLYFHELMADPFGQLERVYAGAGVPFDQQTRDAFQHAIDANKRGKHGQLAYDLREDFGIEPAAIRERFQFYYDRFPQVRIEVK
ncbi:sulfotransferase [Novosphingobium sp.]|uniref:sulfotransferase family protein n=1 Tax=Novosphingobium sp. TaxID=1874826 RepID=UPI00352B07F0